MALCRGVFGGGAWLVMLRICWPLPFPLQFDLKSPNILLARSVIAIGQSLPDSWELPSCPPFDDAVLLLLQGRDRQGGGRGAGQDNESRLHKRRHRHPGLERARDAVGRQVHRESGHLFVWDCALVSDRGRREKGGSGNRDAAAGVVEAVLIWVWAQRDERCSRETHCLPHLQGDLLGRGSGEGALARRPVSAPCFMAD